MSIKRMISLCLAVLALVCLTGCAKHGLGEPKEPFDTITNYLDWADGEGYSSGLLSDDGPEGLNQDRFYTLPGKPGYDSGRIVVGDSRCCQLGIYERRAGSGEYAVFAVWGGHYTEMEPYLPTEEFYKEVEACFQRQIRKRGASELFFFATVNDYDVTGEYNAQNVAAAIACAERLASMRYVYKGREYAPTVTVIGIAGASWEGFNLSVDEYNELLKNAVSESEVLRDTASRFTTVPELTEDNVGFINDGLHYDDSTLKTLAEYIIK